MPDSDTKAAFIELSSAQRKAIPHILASRSTEEAAKAAGISARTLYRWFAAEPAFTAAIFAAESDLVDYATRRLLNLADKSITALESVLDDEAARTNTKVRAALGILATMAEMRSLRNLEIRLAALERLYHDGTSKP